MRPRRFALPQAGTGGYGIRPYVFLWRAEPPRRGRCPAWSFLPLSKTKPVGAHSICARGNLPYRKQARADMESAPTFLWRRSHRAEGVPRVKFSPFVESEIRRGAFYMRPRKFILPQAGTGGYGIRPYVFCGGRSPLAEGGAPRGVFSLLAKTTSVGAHSICARGSLPYRKRARADMESAPYVFVAGGPPRAEGGAPRAVFSLCSKAKSVGAHSICARGSLSCRKRARADMESAPTFFCGGRAPPPRRGGQGARFCLLCVQTDLFPLAPCQKPSYVVYYFSTSPQANPVQTGDAKL